MDNDPADATQRAADQPVGRLVSVNVGLPRDVGWQGRTVHTGVWKYPVDGPRMVRTRNIDGDGQGDLAGHGGPHRAVLVYQQDSYQFWRNELGRDDLSPGRFGENFTVDGLSDDSVCIGDRYEIGDALFEVSQPRVTCYRVGLRLDEPRLPALLVTHRRPGFYLRVLREGLVRAGDPIVKIRSGPEQMTVRDVDALLYLPGHQRADIERALRISALSPGWQGSFQAMLNTGDGASGNIGLTDAAGVPPVAWPGFRKFRVVDVERETASVVSLRLAQADGGPAPGAEPGQFVAIRLTIGGAQSTIIRNYSLSGPTGQAEYRVSVKREPHGLFSAYVHDHVRTGTVVELAAPRGGFVLTGDGPVLLLSAGIGATPVLAMLYALAGEKSTSSIWWMHGARNSTEHPFAAEVRMLLAELPHSRCDIFYSAPLPTDQLGRDNAHRGRLDADVLGQLAIPPGAHAYICGPESFMDDIGSALVSLGIDHDHISTERFGARPAITPGIEAAYGTVPHQPVGETGTGPDVSFSRSGLIVPWRSDVSSILELAEACDVPTRWSCRTGICHTCETGLLAGTVDYDPPVIDEPAAGNVLVCSARPRENVVVDL